MKEIFSTAHLMGGLGNQMFQIANAFAQSLDGNINCYFKPYSQTELQGKTANNYVNNIFKKLNFKQDLPNVKRYYEPNFSYNEKKFDWNESIEFYGYYQSSKNFLNFSEEVKSLFLPNEDSEKYLSQKYPQILNNDTLSLHVRIGDFKKFPDIHPTINIDYINQAIKKIGDYSYLFVFSDDKEWVYNNIKYDNIIIVNEEDYLEMWLMSMCKNNIMSNSTFSWWGAFLNTNQNKKVVVPSKWFGVKGPKDYQDIYENNWIKI